MDVKRKELKVVFKTEDGSFPMTLNLILALSLLFIPVKH